MRDRAVRTPRSALLTAVLAAVVTIGALVFVWGFASFVTKR